MPKITWIVGVNHDNLEFTVQVHKAVDKNEWRRINVDDHSQEIIGIVVSSSIVVC